MKERPMTTQRPTELPGDKLRKAVDEFARLRAADPDLTANSAINDVSKKYDLSPLECEFLRRQLLEKG